MATVSVRYIVDDVDAAIAFYCGHLGFTMVMHPAPAFAMLARGDLRLVLSAPGGGPGGGQAMPDGTLPAPGGWNRFSVEVDDLEPTVSALRAAGVRFRNDIVTGAGGKQILVEDPSGNPVELFEPTRTEARLADSATPPVRGASDRARRVDPDRPRAGASAGPPRRRRRVAGDRPGGSRGDPRHRGRHRSSGAHLAASRRARRAEYRARRRSRRAERGVFSTRSPARPNPIGLHQVTVVALDDGKLRVEPLEAIDGDPAGGPQTSHPTRRTVEAANTSAAALCQLSCSARGAVSIEGRIPGMPGMPGVLGIAGIASCMTSNMYPISRSRRPA